VVLHRGGINFGPSLGESFALVEAQGAQGAKVGSGRTVTVAGNGYAVLPYTSPYRWNQVQLDTAALPLDVEVQASSQRVAPSAGSIVKVSFQTRNDRLWLIDASDADGHPLPYGAQIAHPDGVLGQVGQGGVVALRGLKPLALCTCRPKTAWPAVCTTPCLTPRMHTGSTGPGALLGASGTAG
jgi:outer membrane usher protein